MRTIRAVSRWRDMADIYGTDENTEKADNMLAEVERLLAEIGVKNVEGASTKRAAKKSKQSCPVLRLPFIQSCRVIFGQCQSISRTGHRRRPHRTPTVLC